LPSSLCFYSTVLEDEVDVDGKKVGEYKNKVWFPYYGTTMISTEAPPTFTNTNIGSFSIGDANNYVDLTGQTITFNSGQNITICFWFKLTSNNGNGTLRFPFRIGSTFNTDLLLPEFNYNSSGVLTNFFVYGLTSSGARFVPNTAMLNNWVHFSIVFTHAAVAKLYVNGSTLFTSTNGNNNFNSTINSQGGRIPYSAGNNMPTGLLTEIRVYKEALSQTQIQNIYNWNGTGQPTY
jgi:hypothetical protein